MRLRKPGGSDAKTYSALTHESSSGLSSVTERLRDILFTQPFTLSRTSVMRSPASRTSQSKHQAYDNSVVEELTLIE